MRGIPRQRSVVHGHSLLPSRAPTMTAGRRGYGSAHRLRPTSETSRCDYVPPPPVYVPGIGRNRRVVNRRLRRPEHETAWPPWQPKGDDWMARLPAEFRRAALRDPDAPTSSGGRMSDRAEPFIGKKLTERKFAVTNAMLDDYLRRPGTGTAGRRKSADDVGKRCRERLLRRDRLLEPHWSSVDAPGLGLLRRLEQGRDVHGEWPHPRHLSAPRPFGRLLRGGGEGCRRRAGDSHPSPPELPAREARHRSGDLPRPVEEARRAQVRHSGR